MVYWNGLTIALDKLRGATPTTIINFMKARGFNAIRLYIGWGNGKNVTGSFYSGDINNPMSTWCRTFCTDLFAQAVQNGFLLVVSIADQYTSFSQDYPEEIQRGYNGGTSSSANWIDVKGPNFITMESNLVRQFVRLMRDTPGMIPWVNIDEITYTTADSGPAFYAAGMKNAYLADTGKTAPRILSTDGSYDNLTADQKQYFDYVKNAIADFFRIMAQAAFNEDPNCRFGAMVDYIWNLAWYLRDVEPLEYFGTLNNLVAEWFYGIQNQIWTGTRSLPDCYTKIWNLNPNAYHYFNYGRLTYTNGEATIRRLITEVIAKGYHGGFLYEYYDVYNNTTIDFTDLTGPKPPYENIPPPPKYWTLNVSSQGNGTTSPPAGSSIAVGETVSYTVSVTSGTLAYWELDGVNMGSASSITVPAQVANSVHTLVAVFTTKHYLTITSIPIVGIPVTVNGMATGTTPVSFSLDEGNYQIEMPTTHQSGTNIYDFVDWEDGSTNPTRIVNLTIDRTLTATYKLRVVTYALSIIGSGGGTTNPVPGTYEADEGTTATVTAVPNNGYMFVNWLLDGINKTENPINILMNMNHSITPTFEVSPPEKRYLTIVAINGQTNPAQGTYEYDVNSSVPVTATPNSGYKFKEWLLDNVQAGTQPFITVTMDVNHTVVAMFEEVTPPVQAGFPIWIIPVALIGMSVVYMISKKK
jgi:hypothetical protein